MSEKMNRWRKQGHDNLILTDIFLNFQEMVSLNDARMNHQRQNFL